MNMSNQGKLFAAAMLVFLNPAFASELTIPNTFSSGTPAVADEVNANFSAVESAVDDNDSRISGNTSDIATNAADIANNTSDISSLNSSLPGVDWSDASSTPTLIPSNITSVTLSAPAAGYVVVHANGEACFTPDALSNAVTTVGVSNVTETYDGAHQVQITGAPGDCFPFSHRRIYTVPEGDSTFYLVADTTNASFLFQPSVKALLTVQYYPKRY